ncbi:MAG TPA: peptidase U32 family protein [Melioribacteraceae bacterium]|nr:peptidase U32 family protein [Melioribacteraceae bacterium]
MENRRKPLLLAPAGNWTMLNTAISAGADEIYFGVKDLNMRAKANNFDISELPEIVSACREKNVKTHLTLNSIVFEHELEQLDRIVKAAKSAGVDMIICWDHAVIMKCREYGIPFCISTQASISNSQAALYFENLGAGRVVLARECTLDKIIEIKQKTNVEVEVFIHGAMCIAVSGRCFMSHEIFDKSANRGECIQPCRREYEIIDKDDKYSMIVGEDYILSPKDLCTIGFIDKLIEAGIDAFKIEGRKRSPEYIGKTVSVYREAIERYFSNTLSREKKEDLENELKKVYNRGFSPGFYLGQPGSESYAKSYGSIATTRKVYAGKVVNYYKKSKIAQIKIEAEKISSGDLIYITGNTTGNLEISVGEIYKDDLLIATAEKGDNVTIQCGERVREFDKVYKIIELER